MAALVETEFSRGNKMSRHLIYMKLNLKVAPWRGKALGKFTRQSDDG